MRRKIRPVGTPKMSIREMLDKVPNYVEPAESIDIVWGVAGTGWGQLHFYIGEDKKVHCDNENMSKRFIKEQLCKMVEECILDDPPSQAYRGEKNNGTI